MARRSPPRVTAASAAAKTMEAACVAMTVLRTSSRSTSTPLKSPSTVAGRNWHSIRKPDGDRRVRQLEDEPRGRDVLHPGPRDGDDLAREEDPVVPVLAEAAPGAAVGPQERRGHAPSSISFLSAGSAASTAASSSGSRRLQPGGQPGGAPAPRGAEDAHALLRQRQLDAAPVALRAPPGDQSGRSRGGRRRRSSPAARRPRRPASSRTPIPGLDRIAQRSDACPPVMPSGPSSLRSRRFRCRSVGRRPFATSTGSVIVNIVNHSIGRPPAPPHHPFGRLPWAPWTSRFSSRRWPTAASPPTAPARRGSGPRAAPPGYERDDEPSRRRCAASSKPPCRTRR